MGMNWKCRNRFLMMSYVLFLDVDGWLIGKGMDLDSRKDLPLLH